MNRLLIFTLSSLVFFSLNEKVFSTGQSKLSPTTEFDENDQDPSKYYLQHELVTNKEETQALFKKLTSEPRIRRDAVLYFAEHIVSPWLMPNFYECELFRVLVSAPEFGENFYENMSQINENIQNCIAPKAEQFINCLESLDICDKHERSLVEEALWNIYHVYMKYYFGTEESSDFFEHLLQYLNCKNSIYAKYKIQEKEIKDLLNHPDSVCQKNVNKNQNLHQKRLRAKIMFEELLDQSPLTRSSLSTRRLAQLKSLLGDHPKEIVALLEESIDLQYTEGEKLRKTNINVFIRELNIRHCELGIAYMQYAAAKNLTEKKSKKLYKKAAKAFEQVLQQDSDEMKKCLVIDNLSCSIMYKDIGNEKKSNEYLQLWQQEELKKLNQKEELLKERRRKRAELIKKHVQANQMIAQQEVKEKSRSKRNHAAPTQVKKGDEERGVYSTSSPERVPSSFRKEKIKTRKVPNLQDAKTIPKQTAKTPGDKEVEHLQKTKIEDILDVKSKAYKNFCELFSDYEEGKQKALGIRSISISMHKVQKLLNEIHKSYDTLKGNKPNGKGFDSSKGKGSHGKGELLSDKGRTVFTLSKKQYLLPYQIKHLLKGFVKLGYYPQSLEDALRKSGDFEEEFKSFD